MAKNWDHHIVSTEAVARSAGFRVLRERILTAASPRADDVAVDIGAGTGLLTLPLADLVDEVWAIDISRPMCDYLEVKAASAGLHNIQTAASSAVSLPLVDRTADLVVSNYCLHHLSHRDKDVALQEIFRVLKPGGRVVLGDMMFAVGLGTGRSRRLAIDKVRGLLSLGPRGALRLLRNALRFVTGRWEKPVSADWWGQALERAGFEDVTVEVLTHEGGVAVARRPGAAAPGAEARPARSYAV